MEPVQINTPSNASQSHGQDTPATENEDTPQASPHDSPQLSPIVAEGNDSANKAPLQKRRRVTRACDECRRKKIKCDGKQPCTHCTVYSYECTYDQPSNRRRNAAPQYIEALENQLKRADAILKLIIPNTDLNDPQLEAKIQSGLLGRQQLNTANGSANGINHTLGLSDGGMDSHLESMVKSTGQLDLDEQGNLEYHGHSSGLSFVRRMREQLGDVMGPEGQATPFVKSRPMSQVFDSPRSTSDSLDTGLGVDLPPREVARTLCDNAINDACALLRIVHWPTFVKQLDAIYDTPQENYGNDENAFLPLLYATMALGTLFGKEEGGELDKKGYESAINEGFKYFRASRALMDIADCRDLRQLQAIIFMIMFLQSSAKLSVCYAYIGVALRSALRMGLHRSFPDNFTPIVAETRKRVFWAIQRMDTYVGALLGLPHSLNDEDIDQEFPAEVDDEFITDEGISRMPEGRISVMAACNAHVTLVAILAKIVRYVYPLKGSQLTVHGKPVKSYSVSYSKILEIERDLQEWQDKLPLGLKPGGDAPVLIIRVQHLLRMSYAHAQMMLYRPFLHYVSQTCKSRVVDKRSYACAAACVSVSRNIIHIAVEMHKRKLLVGAYWFTMYTTFFAILSLVFYALENPENEASRDVLRVAKEGKDTLESLAKRSMAADRCTATLAALFEQLPERLSRTRQNSVSSRKRRQEESSHPLMTQVDLSSSDSSGNGDSKAQPQRANTYTVSSSSRPTDFIQTTTLPQSLDGNAYTVPTTHGFYDISSRQSPGTGTTGTPSLSSGLSQPTESFPMSPNNLNDQSFPLVDLSSMMFPSSDPFAYPNQSAAPAQSYDQLLKNLGDDPAFPYSASLEALRLQRAMGGSANGFMPPSSTFMMGAQAPDFANSESEVQLLGPMAPYLMQGSSTQQESQSTNATPHTNQSFSPAPSLFQCQQQAQQPLRRSGMSYSAMSNMNLSDLLGGEEWAGSVDRLGGLAGPAASVKDSAFNSPLHQEAPRNANFPTSATTMNDELLFDEPTPNNIAWGLGGY